jgi:tryptophan synthase beta subunit
LDLFPLAYKKHGVFHASNAQVLCLDCTIYMNEMQSFAVVKLQMLGVVCNHFQVMVQCLGGGIKHLIFH